MQWLTMPINRDGSFELHLTCGIGFLAPNAPPPPLGIGVVIQEIESYVRGKTSLGPVLHVVDVKHLYPAQRAGLTGGDVIISVDDAVSVSASEFTDTVRSEPRRARLIGVSRDDMLHFVEVMPSQPGGRTPVDPQRCKHDGNPIDYWYGSIATPYDSSGTTIIPQYPGTMGYLFDPARVEIVHRSDSPEVTIGRPFEFNEPESLGLARPE